MSTSCFDITQDARERQAAPRVRLLNITWAQYSREWNSTLHTHRHAEMFFVMEGEGSFQLRHGGFRVAARDLVIINPGVAHCETSRPESPLGYIVLGVDGLQMDADELGYVRARFRRGWEAVNVCLRLMLQEARAAEEGWEAVCQRLLEVILLRALRRSELSLASASAAQGESRECDLVRRYIDEHFKENLSLDQLAELAHINKYYLVHAFRKAYGTSPINYLNSRRIQESRFLLSNSDHSLTQISRILGFSSPSYFSQSFRRAEGMSPIEYRRSHSGGAPRGEG